MWFECSLLLRKVSSWLFVVTEVKLESEESISYISHPGDFKDGGMIGLRNVDIGFITYSRQLSSIYNSINAGPFRWSSRMHSDPPQDFSKLDI